MKRWISKSYKNKLYATFIMIWIIPILLLIFFDYIYVYDSTVKNTESFKKSNLKIAAQLIESDLSTFHGIINSIASNEEVAEIIKSDWQGKRRDFSETQRLYSISQTAMAGLPQNVPLHIVNRYGASCFSTTNYFLPIYSDERGNLYDAMIENADTGRISSQIHWRVDGDDLQDISYVMGKAILDPESGAIVGYVIMDIYNSYFQNIFRMIATQAGSNILATDHRNIVIADMENRYYPGYRFDSGNNMGILDESGSFDLVVGAAAYRVYYESADYLGMKVIELIPRDYFIKTTWNNIKTHIIFFSILIALGVFVIMYNVFIMVTPIKTLDEAMKRVASEDYSVRVEISGEDEIARLGRSFNDMASHIQYLIEENYHKQISLQKSEVKALKAQTNPHFLYNCLNSIQMMTLIGQKDEVLQMTKALSKYYRNRVNTETEMVTIDEELKQSLNYLEIQSIRYKDKLTIKTDIDPAVLDKLILKLILQPLIENAVVHGIEQKVDKGMIIIRAYWQNDRVRIEILDDGNGPGTSNAKGENTGILNTKMRLNYHYGENYHLTVFRRDGFTVAELDLPLE